MGKSTMIISWGEILWDRFADGAILGGAPANVAFHLARIGAQSVLVSRVGNDADGRLATETLASVGVDVNAVQIDSHRSTGEVGVAISPTGDAGYTLHLNRAWERIECGLTEKVLLGRADGFCFGTLAQRTKAGRQAHRAALGQLPEQAISLCDANLRQGFNDWPVLAESLLAARAVKLNEIELAIVECELSAPLSAVDWLFDKGRARWIAITRGRQGCSLFDRDFDRAQSVSHPGVAAEPGGDNVGCGDAFVAVFIHGLVSGWPLALIAERANHYAAKVASHRGATSTSLGPQW